MNSIQLQYYLSTINDKIEIDNFKIVFQLLNESIENKIVSNYVYFDLEVFSGYQDNLDNNLWNIINFTTNLFGRVCLQNIISQPLNDTNQLLLRQSYLKKLEFKYQVIKPLLLQLNTYQTSIIDLWNIDKLDSLQKQLKTIYFQSPKLKFINKNPYLIGGYTLYRVLLSPILTMLAPVICMIVPYILIKLVLGVPMSFQFYYNIMKVSMMGLSNFLPNNDFITLIRYFGYGLWIFSYSQNLYNHYELSNTIITTTHQIHLQLYQIIQFITQSIEIINIVEPDIPIDLLPLYHNLLKDHKFLSKPNKNIYQPYGLILSTYNIILETKDSLKPLLYRIGNIDSHLSILSLKYNYNFNFTEYKTNRKKPFIYAKNIYHPNLLRFQKPIIYNTIKIGTHKYPNNIIITGPNAGGKSTFIKSLVISILLSQTITITPCLKFQMTPFSIINTYLNIPDDKGKQSLFQAELNRAISHIQYVKKLPQNEFSFIVMDEIFSSTTPDEAIVGAFTIAELLSKYRNSTTIITTHFKELTKITHTNPEFSNYQFPIIKDKNNQIQFTYKLRKGVSQQSIALDLIKSIVKTI